MIRHKERTPPYETGTALRALRELSTPCMCVSIIKGGKEIAKSLKSNMEFGRWKPNQERKEGIFSQFTLLGGKKRRV